VVLCLLPATTVAFAGEIPEAPPVEATVPGIMFEESALNGKAPSVILPEPDDCLGPPDLEELPRIAIIIDDMGHHHDIGGELLNLDLNLTYSFLPHAPFTREQATHAWELGRDILVHMPMEPRDSMWDPGPGALYLRDTPENIALAVAENIALVPHALGVNNHMGSRFTADRPAMQEVLAVLRTKSLFFVDSMTTSGSVGEAEARKMGIRTASRHVFLDNSQIPEDICRQLKRLVAYAKKHGTGIAIGHPNRATVNALRLCREALLQQVRIVGIHELVN
jgi:hypothetical protein